MGLSFSDLFKEEGALRIWFPFAIGLGAYLISGILHKSDSPMRRVIYAFTLSITGSIAAALFYPKLNQILAKPNDDPTKCKCELDQMKVLYYLLVALLAPLIWYWLIALGKHLFSSKAAATSSQPPH